MIETVFALLLILNGEIIEHTYKEKLSACMKSARIAKKEVNPEINLIILIVLNFFP